MADGDVDKVVAVVNRHLAALIRLQRLTGARSGELVRLRGCDLDTTATPGGTELWVYRPARRKTAHHGKAREIYFGPQAQAVVRPLLEAGDRDAYLLSPRRAREERFAALRAARRSKVPPSQRCRRRATPKVQPGERYTPRNYRQAVVRACRKAGVTAWHPHQLRHAAATALRKAYGVELARVVLGHSTAFTTEIYAEVDRAKAMDAMAQMG